MSVGEADRLEDSAVRGVRWTFLTYLGTRVLGVAATLILARLLVPADFGLFAFAALSIQLVVHFTSLGLAPALVIRPDLDRRALGTVETLMLALGPVSAGLLLVIAPIAADILGNHRLVGVLAVLTIPVAFGGVADFHSALLQRGLAFRTLSACRLAQAATAAAVSVLLASMGAGVWSIVLGQVVGAAVYAAALVAWSPFRVKPRFVPRVARDHARHGIGFVLQGGFSFLEENMDYLAVGSLNGARPLGAYSFAYRLSALPSNAIVEPIAQVTFPGFARMKHRGEDFSPPFLGMLRSVAIVGCPIALMLAAAAEPFVRTVLGERWLLMVGPLSVLGLWGAVKIVETTIAWMLNSVGVALALGRTYAALIVLTTPLLVLAANRGGPTAVSVVMLGNVLAMLAIVLGLATRTVGISGTRMWTALRPVALAAVPTWLVARGLAAGVGLPSALALLSSVAGGSLTYIAVVLGADRGALRELLRQVSGVWYPPSRERVPAMSTHHAADSMLFDGVSSHGDGVP